MCHHMSENAEGLPGEVQRCPAQETRRWSSVPTALTARRSLLSCSVLSPLVCDRGCAVAGPAAWGRECWEMEQTGMFLFQVEATLLKMHDSWNNLPPAPRCLILSCSPPPAHKASQYLVLLPFALPSAHPPGCQVRRCAEVLPKYGFCHLCHPHNRWTC